MEALKNAGFIYNDADFCRKTGLQASFVSEMKAGKKPFTALSRRKIEETFPDFFGAKIVQMEVDTDRLLRIIEDHDIRFHELANRILDGWGVPRPKKEAAAS